jgi:hypothetical protein
MTDIDDHTLTKTYIFMLRSSPISWSYKKQSTTSCFDYKSKYHALANYTCEVLWLCRLLEEIGCIMPEPTSLEVDNQSAIKHACMKFHDKTKHFEVNWHVT